MSPSQHITSYETVMSALSQEPLMSHTAEDTPGTHLFLSRFSEAASLQAKKEGMCLLLPPSLPDLGDLLLPLHDTPSPAPTQGHGKDYFSNVITLSSMVAPVSDIDEVERKQGLTILRGDE